jgi:GNAT superfamily N-acetyltransferase
VSQAAEAQFDAAMLRRLPDVAMRPETENDQPFLRELFVDCSPLAAALPESMLAQQAALANGGFRAAHPFAMRRIALHAAVPVGRIMIDWDCAGRSHGVDIAVLRSARASGLALAMLRAWLEVADALGCACTLEVLATNPAMAIYQRLGFAPLAIADEYQPVTDMIRPVGGRS